MVSDEHLHSLTEAHFIVESKCGVCKLHLIVDASRLHMYFQLGAKYLLIAALKWALAGIVLGNGCSLDVHFPWLRAKYPWLLRALGSLGFTFGLGGHGFENI